jgi:PAS domain S-box-containing protein
MRATASYTSVAPLLIGRPVFGHRRREAGTLHLWLPLAALVVTALSHSMAAAPTQEGRRILILNEAGPSYPAVSIINQGIQAALHDSPYHLEFYSEHFDTLLFPDPDVQQGFRDFYLRKYRHRKPDVIITVGPSPLRFMQEVHQKAFPGVPIVFCLPVGSVPGAPALDSDFTGVGNDSAPAETVEIALRLQPGTEHVVVVGGVSDFDKLQLAYIKQQLKGLADDVDIAYMTDLAEPELIERLRHLPGHTLVLLTSMAQDAAGTRFRSDEVGPIVAAAANAPVFSLFDVYLNHGEVGGYVSTLSEQGKFAGAMALRILRGEKPRGITRVKGANTYMFDWRPIKRWGLMERELPPGSIVINRQLTFWEAYRHYIIPWIAVILAETVLIFGLLWQRNRRNKSEVQLRESGEQLRLAVQAARMYSYEWNPVTDVVVRSYEFADLPSMSAEPARTTRQQLLHKVHPDDRAKFVASVAERTPENPTCQITYRLLQDDGSTVWVEKTGRAFFDSKGKMLRMIGMVSDISERKLAEAKLREYERAVEGSEEMIAVIDREYRYLIANRKFLNMRNMAKEQVVGHLVPEVLNKGVFEAVVKEKVDECFKGRVVRYEMKYTYPNLGKRDVSISCFPIEGVSGVDRVACIMQDVTERKRAEAALVDVNRRLIEAQEQERMRIGRELHDDVTQRLAFLALGLAQLQQNPAEVQSRVGKLRKEISEILSDVEALSHELHSAKLQYLGVVAGIRSWCREFGERQNLEIDLRSDIGSVLPFEIGVCLFRVLQEALHNVVKHSEVKSVEVRLMEESNRVHLIVSDSGKGFDVESAIQGKGLGLTSMRERVRLMSGTIAIESRLMAGTTIEVRVPLQSQQVPQQAFQSVQSSNS